MRATPAQGRVLARARMWIEVRRRAAGRPRSREARTNSVRADRHDARRLLDQGPDLALLVAHEELDADLPQTSRQHPGGQQRASCGRTAADSPLSALWPRWSSASDDLLDDTPGEPATARPMIESPIENQPSNCMKKPVEDVDPGSAAARSRRGRRSATRPGERAVAVAETGDLDEHEHHRHARRPA